MKNISMKKLCKNLVMTVTLLAIARQPMLQGSQAPDPTQQLWDAIENRDIAGAQRAINNGADVNAKDSDGKTPLFRAVFKEHKIIQPLIDAGANVDAKNNKDLTPLHDAAWYDKDDAIQILVKAGADINARDGNNHTPLENAKYNNAQNAVEMLRSLGAEEGPTQQLWDAIKKGDLTKTQQAINDGADVNAKDDGGKTPLFAAVFKAHLIQPLIKAGADVDARDNHWNTALHDAAWFGKPDAVKELLAAGANLKALDQNPKQMLGEKGNTPLDKAKIKNGQEANYQQAKALLVLNTEFTQAIEDENIAKIQETLLRGADINVKTVYGYYRIPVTPLVQAIKQYNRRDRSLFGYGKETVLEIINILLDNGANVNGIDQFGRTALMEAVQYGNEKIVEALLKHGANVNAADEYGKTALIIAIEKGHTQIANMLLLTHAIDIDAETSDGNTALTYAREQGNNEMVELLEAYQKRYNAAQEEAVEQQLPASDVADIVSEYLGRPKKEITKKRNLAREQIMKRRKEAYANIEPTTESSDEEETAKKLLDVD